MTDVDVLIIGGGPSGLQAAMSLSRVLRTVVMFDSGQYRNSATLAAHDLIGFDGTPPSVIRGTARQELARYNATFQLYDTTITTVTNYNNGTYFSVGNGTHTWTGRKLVLGTGVTDILTPVPGLVEIWGIEAYWCPWCDGYEHKNRSSALVVLDTNNDLPVEKALVTKLQNPESVVLANGLYTDKLVAATTKGNPYWQQMFAADGITVDNRKIASFALSNPNDKHSDVIVTFTDSSTMARGAILLSPPQRQTSPLGDLLGVRLTTDNSTMIVRSREGSTNVYGVYAIGDAGSAINGVVGSKTLANAIYSGKSCGVHVANVLAKEDAGFFRLSGGERDMKAK